MSKRFASLLDAHGGRLGDWPESERTAAEAFVARDPYAARELDRAERLEEALDAWAAPVAGPDLRRRLASIPGAETAREPWWAGWFGAPLRAAVGFGAALALGVLAGISPVGSIVDEAIAPDSGVEAEIEVLVTALMEVTGE